MRMKTSIFFYYHLIPISRVGNNYFITLRGVKSKITFYFFKLFRFKKTVLVLYLLFLLIIIKTS